MKRLLFLLYALALPVIPMHLGYTIEYVEKKAKQEAEAQRAHELKLKKDKEEKRIREEQEEKRNKEQEAQKKEVLFYDRNNYNERGFAVLVPFLFDRNILWDNTKRTQLLQVLMENGLKDIFFYKRYRVPVFLHQLPAPTKVKENGGFDVTLLQAAVIDGNNKMVTFILSLYKDTEDKNDSRLEQTWNILNERRYALENNSELWLTSPTSVTQDFLKSYKNNLEKIREILREWFHITPQDLLNKDLLRYFFSHETFSEQDFKIVKELLAQGANINVQDRTYGTALEHAVQNGALNIIIFLLENGAQVNNYVITKNDNNFNVTLRGLYKNDPNHKHTKRILQILMEHGLDLNSWAPASFYKRGDDVAYSFTITPLMWAVRHGSIDLIKFLLHGVELKPEFGAKYRASLITPERESYFTLLPVELRRKILEFKPLNKADPAATDQFGRTAIQHIPIGFKSEEKIKQIREILEPKIITTNK